MKDKNSIKCVNTNLLPLTKKSRFLFEKAMAPTAPMWPIPTPTQLVLSESHNLTYTASRHLSCNFWFLYIRLQYIALLAYYELDRDNTLNWCTASINSHRRKSKVLNDTKEEKTYTVVFTSSYNQCSPRTWNTGVKAQNNFSMSR